MGNPACTMVSMHKCDVPDAAGTHFSIPVFFPCSPSVKTMKLKAGKQGDSTLCLHRLSTPAGLLPIPLPNLILKGSMKVKFGGKPAARRKDMMAHGGKISHGTANVMIGG